MCHLFIFRKRLDGETIASRHNAMPFGCTASVKAWDRIGHFLRCVAVALFHMPVFRWVDDFFAAEGRKTVKHAANCFARLVRSILGADITAEEELCWGNPMPILGLRIQGYGDDAEVWLPEKKVEKWSAAIRSALESKKLSATAAAKLAGRLSFTAQSTFYRLGRAMVRPIFKQQYYPLPGGRYRFPFLY